MKQQRRLSRHGDDEWLDRPVCHFRKSVTGIGISRATYLQNSKPSTLDGGLSLRPAFRIAYDPRAIRAKQTVAKLDSDLTRFWIDKRSGRDPEIVRRYNNAVATAPSLGITYLEKDFVDRLRLDAIVDRLALLQHLPDGPKLQEAAVAVAGIARIPGLMLSELRTEGERHLAAELKPNPAISVIAGAPSATMPLKPSSIS